ncbi:family 43 glycosylhydrolase [Fulvivirga ligni]|uniref:family 43 glycosylhydrolase n=1 Tax=Fulvivirga ligni TaxID=2904246 RepID=UPI001F3A36DC|nr:family 43 glycosylhydrolase [Fulvivirga ligni]UII19763.1 family 43 glycosylhydrolase [Fulvivirga ligni]
MKKTAHLIALWLAIFVGSVSVKAQQCSFTNPLSPNSHADPFVTFHEGFYYYTFTTGLHVEVRKSATLEGIAAAEPIGVWRSWEEPAIDGPPWAPELHYLNGKWYIYTTGKVPGSDEMRVIVLEGDSPQSKFRYVANLAGGIDATILKHTNGQLYMVWMRNEAGSLTNITIAPMTSPTSLGQGWTQISEPNIDLWYNWEKSHQVCNEGPQIIHRNGKFFLTYSANASWTEHYCLGMFTCDDKANVMDRNSWVKSPTPIFQKSYENGVVGVGHASFTTSPDGKEDWILFHGMDDSNGDGVIETGWENRHPFAQRISWHSDGTPNIGIPQPGGVQMTCAGGAGEFVRLQSANFPDRYIRHSESRGRIDAGVSPLGDGQFKMVPGLADPNAVSLESVNYPGHFLRHRNGEIWMDPNYGDNLYKNDATWWVRPGLSNAAGMSFESYNFPGNFIRHRGSLLYSENPGGLPADATFFKIATSVNGGLSSGNTLLVEAENYNLMSGIQIEGCSEGGQNVGWIEADDWMVYDVLLPVAGTYTVEYRVASPNGGGVIEFEKAGGAPDYGTITVPATGGWQNWTTISHQVNLPAGQQQVAIHALSNGYNLNWFKLTPVANAANNKIAQQDIETEGDLSIYPNPGKDVVYLKLQNEATVSIRDVQGKTVVNPIVYNSETGLDISSLNNGIYLVVIETDDSQVSQKLVVKK